MTKDEALRLALEALEYAGPSWIEARQPAITALKEALANEALDKMAENARELGLDYEPAQEPVAFINVEQRKLEWAKYMSWDTPTVVNLPKIPLYTTPPQRTWVGLTDEDLEAEFGFIDELLRDTCYRTEAKLRSKNCSL
jgi:hypothetical protein